LTSHTLPHSTRSSRPRLLRLSSYAPGTRPSSTPRRQPGGITPACTRSTDQHHRIGFPRASTTTIGLVNPQYSHRTTKQCGLSARFHVLEQGVDSTRQSAGWSDLGLRYATVAGYAKAGRTRVSLKFSRAWVVLSRSATQSASPCRSVHHMLSI